MIKINVIDMIVLSGSRDLFLSRSKKKGKGKMAESRGQKLKNHVAANAFRSSRPKYPEKKQKLEKLANSLKETDNPVLVLISLK